MSNDTIETALRSKFLVRFTAAVLTFLGGAAGAAAPAPQGGRPSPDAPSAAAPAPAQPKQMPAKYSILLYRSIFTKEHSRVPVASNSEANDSRRSRLTTTTGPTTASAEPSVPRYGRESDLALKGVALVDGEYVAFIEDLARNNTLFLKVGDPLSHGSIKRLSLNGMDYDRTGKEQRIEVGQNLEGMLVRIGGDAGAPASGGPPAAPGDAGAAAPAVTGSGGSNDVLERMRLKRLRGE